MSTAFVFFPVSVEKTGERFASQILGGDRPVDEEGGVLVVDTT